MRQRIGIERGLLRSSRVAVTSSPEGSGNRWLQRWEGGCSWAPTGVVSLILVLLFVGLTPPAFATEEGEGSPTKYAPISVPEAALDHPDESFAAVSKRIANGMASTIERRYWYDAFKRYYPFTAEALPQPDSRARASKARTELPEAVSCNWTNLGPFDFQNTGSNGTSVCTGRGSALWVNPGDKNQILAGFADGGVWKTLDQGATWTPIFDFNDSLSIGSITAVVPAGQNLNSATIWVATGEGHWSSVTGVGVYKSADGGSSWTLQTIPFIPAQANPRGIRRIAVDPRDTNKLWAAADTAMFRTTDGGVNWSRVEPLPYYWKFPSDCWNVKWYDVVIDDSTNPSTLYVAGMTNDTSSSCGTDPRIDSGIYRSTDDGATWTNIAQTPAACPAGRGYNCAGAGFAALPGSVGRMKIISSASAKSHLYALVNDPLASNNILGIWETTDALAATVTWTARSTTNFVGNQGWYAIAGAVHPMDPSRLLVGGLDAWISNDNAATLSQVSDWNSSAYGTPMFAHADHHRMLWVDATTIYDLGDGGLFVGTVNGAATQVDWVHRNGGGVNTIQFYGFANHPTDPYSIHGGLQDNGEVRTISSGSAITGWAQAFGGDGGFSATNQANPDIQYEEYVYAHVRQSTDGGATYPTCFRNFGGCGCAFQCNPDSVTQFIAPLLLDANDQDVFYTGSHVVYRNRPAGSTTWFTYSPSLGNSIVQIHSARDNGTTGTMYAGTADGRVWVTTGATSDTQPTWTERTAAPLPSRSVTWLTTDPQDAQRALVTFSGWGTGHVFRTINGGATWTDISGSLPDEPFHSATIDPANRSHGYVGSDFGVYVNEDVWNGNTWARVNGSTLPHVRANMLEFAPANGRLRVATHGRGIWECGSAPVPNALTVTKTRTSAATTPPGGTVTYSVVVENTSTNAVAAGILGDTLDACFVPIGTAGQPCPTGPGAPSVTCAGAGCGAATCTISNGGLGFTFNGYTLAATDGVAGSGADLMTVTVNVIAGPTPGVCNNVAGAASCTGCAAVSTPPASVTIVSAAASLNLTKTLASAATTPPGGMVTYNVVVENPATTAVAAGILGDTLDPCFVALGTAGQPCPTGPGAPSVTCAGAGCAAATCTISNNGLGFVYSNYALAATDGVAGSGADQMVVTVNVLAGSTPGVCNNVAGAASCSSGCPATSTPPVPVTIVSAAGSLNLTKTRTSAATTPTGGTVTYDVLVENTTTSVIAAGVLGDTLEPCFVPIGTNGQPCPTGPGAPSVTCAGAGCASATCTISNNGLGFVYSGYPLAATDGVAGSGADQMLVTVNVVAGSTPGVCNNMAGAADPACSTCQPVSTPLIPVTIQAAGCELASVLEIPPISTMPPPWVYTNVCSPTDFRVDNFAGTISVAAGASVDTGDSIGPGFPGDLILYQLDCTCGNDVRVTKDRVTSEVKVSVMP